VPIYNFKCKKCGHIEKDVIVRMNTKTIKCPKCGSVMERQISAGVFRFGKKGKIF